MEAWLRSSPESGVPFIDTVFKAELFCQASVYCCLRPLWGREDFNKRLQELEK
jgi:hypothetical protein